MWPNSSVNWPGRPVQWIHGKVLYISVPFTWNLPALKEQLRHVDIEWETVVIGGPAIKLMPDYFKSMDFVTIKEKHGGVLQHINPMATRTTKGCPNKCPYCGVSKICGDFEEFKEYPVLPIICDDNIFAASMGHFKRVIKRIREQWGWCDFNQGVDPGLLTAAHAKLIRTLKKAIVRLAMDSHEDMATFVGGYTTLREAGIPKSWIRSYALIGHSTGPKEAQERCSFIESNGIKVLPMWYHELDALENNAVTEKQKDLGWTDKERRKIMQFYYQHKYPNDCKDG